MRVAVIGAGGFVGKHVCAELSARGVDVFALSAGCAGGIALDSGLLPIGFEFPRGIEAVYFLAQSPRYRQMPEESVHLLSVNCLAVVQAAEAARRAGAVKFVYASSGNVYAPSFSPHAETSPVRRDDLYALSKVMAEDVLGVYSAYFDVTIVRMFGVYGPGQVGKLVPKIADAVRSKQEVYVDRNRMDDEDSDGLRVSLIFIDDLAEAMVKLLSVRNCRIANLAGSEAVSVRRLANVVGASLGLAPRIAVSNKYRDADFIADVGLCERLLGPAKTRLEDGVRRVLRGEGWTGEWRCSNSK